MDVTFVIRIENSLNKKASLTPVFITNKCPVLMFISQVTLFKFALSKHYPAACKSKQTLCKNYHLSLYLQCLLHDILQLVHLFFFLCVTVCLFKFGRNLTKSRGIGIEGECKFSSLVFLSCFSANPHQKN